MRLSVTTRRVLLILIALVFVGLAVLWVERMSIARRFADAELRARQVDAQYTITQVGPTIQRIENVLIGNSADPDLTAKWAEIELTGSLTGIRIKSIRANGVRLKGKLVGGVLTFGAVDRLLPAPTGEPFALPDIDVALSDTQIRLETPYGAPALAIAGRGNIANDFRGTIAAIVPLMAQGKNSAKAVRAVVNVHTDARRVTFSGPVSAETLAAPGIALRGITGRVAGESDERFARPRGNFQLAASVDALPQWRAERVEADGRFSTDGGDAHTLTSNVQLSGLRPNADLAGKLLALVPGAAGTPAEPLARQLRTAIAALGRGSNAKADIGLFWSPKGERKLRVTPNIRSASGAWLRSSGEGLGWDFRTNQPVVNDRLALSGGGFPDMQVQLVSTDKGYAGQVIAKPYTAGGAKLALTPFRFDYTSAGLRLDTVAQLDGPLGTGRVTGLRVPLALRPGASPLSGCLNPSFQRLEISGLVLNPAKIDACIRGKEAQIKAPRFAGRLGRSPITLVGNSARVGLSRGDFSVNRVAVRLGTGQSMTVLDAATLSGVFGNGGAQGKFGGASGKIGAVPLLASNGAGDWTFRNSILYVAGGLRLTDAAPDPRFNPLVSNDFALRLANGIITATATAREPTTLTRVTGVRIEHNLSRGTGSAVLDVNRLTFDNSLQPEMLTHITLGVIANVAGAVTGRGVIRWTPDGVTSTGTFRTDNLDLAAAFGPVTGLKGEIQLSDLLGMETGVTQSIRIASINPGIAVIDGDVKYRLLPGLKAQIEGGRWPFAGGYLILEPTIFDLSAEAERRLTFRVEGLDAAKFIAAMEFDNISATGIFDGTLPMVFDQNGGRLEGGQLVARGEGTLSYIGEISNENLGAMGQFAFDALKSMKYERLTIGLEGPLDGDVVTRVSFKGVNQMPIGTGRTKLPIPVKIKGLNNIPFIFNITITAPFRRLFQMARTIQDPSLLIEQITPGLERVGPAKTLPPADKPIQTPESRP
jgi:translocation and assembly module TamB